MREDWVEIELGDAGRIYSGGTPKTAINEYWGEEIAWISPADLSKYNDKFIARGNKSLTQLGLNKSSAKLIPAGSVLFSSRAPIGYVAIAKNELSTNQGFKSIFPSPLIHNEFVYYYLRASKNLAEKYASGTTFKEISKKAFSELPFPLAPLPEQRAIVAKIEALFSELDQGIADLKKAQDQLKVYRQAVLKKAFEGELTRDWRTKQTNLPTADELLEQIKEERQRHYEQQLEEWKAAVKIWEKNGKDGKKPGKPSIVTKVIPLNLGANNSLRVDQPNWYWSRLDVIAKEMCLGKMLDKKKNQGELKPYLGNINVRWGRFDLKNLKEMRFLDTENERYGLSKGDLVICEGGEPGRCAVWNSDQEMKIQKALHKVSLFESVTLSLFLFYYISYLAEIGLLSDYFTGTTIKHLTGQGLSKIPTPILAFQEQNQIVREIESRLSVFDRVEQTITESLDKAQALRQSILKKAFEGGLLSKPEIEKCKAEPDWEPAEVLLERIKSDKTIFN